ncbi:ABC-type nitrate/sulfonate/bicarbonate transport system, periplasmic component [Candidatus Protofrankia californiensis]|uniref:ABC-type nitrate/sulfonate/bicarbonate transport system, periplasmic component n=2 Tax=Protofrankia TaxID=2994361 RepID=A0A1C3PGK2_9ACTN|nr:ABC-type nitrate/sulfonate/bicarbonate transport system, periplasmic component [Candidatus Protofrankia californiensis]
MSYRRRPMRRLAPLSAVLIALIAVAGIACGGNSTSSRDGSAGTHAGDRLTLRIGDQSKGLQLPLELSGQSQGTPYDLQWNTFADGPHMNAAFSAGKIDIGTMGDTPVLFANAAHADVTVVAISKSTVNSQTIIATRQSGIRTVADLKGKRVAFTTGTSLHGYLLNQLDSVGLTQENVTAVNIPGTSLLATLESGTVDAVVYTRQFIQTYFRKNPDVVEVETKPIPQYSVILAAKNSLKDPAKRAVIQDFLVRLAKASTWPKANPAGWVDAYYVKQLHQDPAASAEYFASLPATRYGPVPDDFVESQRVQARLLIGVGELPKALNVDDEFDAAVAKEFSAPLSTAVPAT